MAVMVTENLAKLMYPKEVYKVFYNQFKLLPDWRDKIFNVTTSSREWEEHVGIGALTMAQDWGGAISYDRFYEGYSKKFTHVFKSRGMILDKKLFMFEKYGVINQRSRLLADSMLRKKLTDAAGFFEDAFTTANGMGDTKALFASDHSSTADSAYSKSNKGTTAFSHTQLATIMLNMQKFTNDRDEQITVEPALIMIPRDLQESVHNVLHSLWRWTTSTDSERFGNYFYQNGEDSYPWRVIVIPQWSDTSDYIVADPVMMKEFLYWYDVQQPYVAATGDFDTLATKVASVMMYSFGTSEWRWGYGSQVA